MRFRYLLNPLWLGATGLYVLNRWAIKPHTQIPLFRFWFNDSLLIPCALPPLLLVQRWLRLRSHDNAPTTSEVFGHLALWSVFFEVIGPHWMHRATGDPRDVAAYLIGAVVSWACWQRNALGCSGSHEL